MGRDESVDSRTQNYTVPVLRPKPVRWDHLSTRLEGIHSRQVFSNRGPEVQELENRVANWLGVDALKVVAVSNATVGLVTAIVASPALRWEVPAWTFPAPALAVLSSARELELVDIDERTWVAKASGAPGTGCIKVVPFGGSFSPEYWSTGMETIVDAAASLATEPRFMSGMPDRASVVFSLHATKAIGGGEGGLVVFGDRKRADFARAFINFGFSGSRDSALPGTNAKMSEYDAAVVNSRLDGWALEKGDWAKLLSKKQEIRSALGLRAVPESMNSINPYWIELFDTEEERDWVETAFHEVGLETRKWWGNGLHNMAAFKPWATKGYPIVDDLSRRTLGLPFFLEMSPAVWESVRRILSSLNV